MDEKAALLNQLRGVEVPVVSGVPALGWWLLLLLIALVLLTVFLKFKSHQQTLWKRQSQQEMRDIRECLGKDTSVESLSRCSALARKVVLAVDNREQVAALHGDAWLSKLDDICARPEFSSGVGRLLQDRQYQKQSKVDQQDMEALFDSMDVLIKSASSYKPARPNEQAVDLSGKSL